MYGPTDLKKNTLITLDGQPYKVIEYSQKVMGRGGSIVNVKVKNLITGALLPKTFKGQEKIESADVSGQTVQYLYNDGEKFYFMNPTTFEQYELSADMIGDAKDFLKEGKEYLENKRAWSKAHPEYEAMRKHRYYMEHREEILQRTRERNRILRAKQKEQENAAEITEPTSQSCFAK